MNDDRINEVYKIFCPLSEREANIYNMCWNRAIEAAANKVESAGNILLAHSVRELKK